MLGCGEAPLLQLRRSKIAIPSIKIAAGLGTRPFGGTHMNNWSTPSTNVPRTLDDDIKRYDQTGSMKSQSPSGFVREFRADHTADWATSDLVLQCLYLVRVGIHTARFSIGFSEQQICGGDEQ